MKKFIITCCFVFFSLHAYAEQALSKALIEQYVQSISKIEQLVKTNPELGDKLDDLMMLDPSQIVKAVEVLADYPQIKSIISSAGFDDFKEYIEIGYRLMGGVFQSQMANMPAGMNMDSFVEQMQGQLENMKKSGMPKEALTELEENLAEQLKSMEFMKKAAASVSPEDIAFVKENLDWIMQMMPSDVE